jgi:hypothetical protein
MHQGEIEMSKPSPAIRGACWIIRCGGRWLSPGPKPDMSIGDNLYAWNSTHMVIGDDPSDAFIVSRKYYEDVMSVIPVFDIDSHLEACKMMIKIDGHAPDDTPVFGDPWEGA